MLRKSYGNTYAEYALIMGLLVVACIGALNITGLSISDLLGGKVAGALGTGGGSSGGKLLGVLSPVAQSGTLTIGGRKVDAKTGLPIAGSSNSSTGGTNATSVEGGSKSEMSLASAIFMESLAAEDPANANLLLNMSKLLFRMGGVQGAYLETGSDRDRSLVVQSNGGYTKDSALYDLQRMQRMLNGEMSRLPIGSSAYGAAQALVADANKIADTWLGDREYSRPAGTDSDYEKYAIVDYLESRAIDKLADNVVNNRHEGTLDDALQSKGKRRRNGG